LNIKLETTFSKEDQTSDLNGLVALLAACFAKYPTADKEAITNFIMTAESDLAANITNLALDSELYKWDVDAQMAIFWCLLRLNNQ
jgi:Na+/H+ antiporter NhaA